MLQLWIGRAGAGKSRRCVDAIAQNRRHRRQLLLVPEHTSHEAEVDLCRALGDTAARDAEVLTFRSLATRVLSQTGGLSDLTVFARPSRRSAFLEQLMKLFDEFAAYAIAPDTLMAQVADLEGTAGDKLRDVALLYAAYDAGSTPRALTTAPGCRSWRTPCPAATIWTGPTCTWTASPSSTPRRSGCCAMG